MHLALPNSFALWMMCLGCFGSQWRCGEKREHLQHICSICSIWHVSRAVLAIWGLGSFAFGSFDPCFDPWGHYSDANVQKCAVQSSSVKEEIECKQVEELGRIAWTEQTWLKSCNWYLTVQTLLSSSTIYHYDDPLHNECIRTVYLISSYTPHIIYIWYRFVVSSFCF